MRVSIIIFGNAFTNGIKISMMCNLKIFKNHHLKRVKRSAESVNHNGTKISIILRNLNFSKISNR